MFRSMRTVLSRRVRLISVLALLSLALGTPNIPVTGATATDQPSPPNSPSGTCADGTQASGAKYRICMPSFPNPSWNGDLLIYAHGYVASTAPVAIPEDQLHLPDGSYIPDVVNWMGYAFATTSYYTNGLAIRAGLTDLANLVSIFKAAHPTVNRIYLVGASEGGLITALAIEQSPSLYSGGLATCGPVGDFRKQIDYMGDFRIVFDYFFPNVLPGAAITVPQSLMDNWETQYLSQTIAVISDPANAISVTQLLSVTHAAVDPLDSTTAISTVTGVLWYNVFATNDAKARLGGQPFDNYTRTYTGSLNDVALNAGVQRYSADQTALNEIDAYYQTAGRPLVPLVTLHTTLDPIVPYWHETLYRDKVVANGLTPRYDNQEATRYGHCNFTASEVQTALTTLVNLVTNPLRFKVFLPLVFKQ